MSHAPPHHAPPHRAHDHRHHQGPTYSVGSEVDGSARLSVRAGERFRLGGSRRPVSLLVLRERGDAVQAFSDVATFLTEYPSAAAPRCEGLLEHAGRPVVVTERLAGSLLSTRLAVPATRARPLTTSAACRRVAALAELVSRLHSAWGGRGLGGIDPGSLWLEADGRLLLLPSAACGLLRRDHAGGAAGAASSVDPDRHRAPEALAGGVVTPQADVYSLGLLLWDLLALGRAACPDATSAPTSHASGGGIDPDVVRLVMACISPEPAERPAGAAALAVKLRPFAAPRSTPRLRPVSVSPPTDPEAHLPWATSPMLVVEGGPASARLPLSSLSSLSSAGGSRWVVGRSESTDLPVADPEMSRQHFEIVRGEDGAFRAYDLGSKNGLFVGREPADGRVLQAGDVLVAGTTRLRFEPARPARAASLCSGPGSGSHGGGSS